MKISIPGILKTIPILILNLGWLFPMYLCIVSLIQSAAQLEQYFWNDEVRITSFPLTSFSEQMLQVTIAWLAIAIAFNTIAVRWKHLTIRQEEKISDH